jgi:hypothetical protein
VNEAVGIHLIGFLVLEKELTEMVVRIIGACKTQPLSKSSSRVKV